VAVKAAIDYPPSPGKRRPCARTLRRGLIPVLVEGFKDCLEVHQCPRRSCSLDDRLAVGASRAGTGVSPVPPQSRPREGYFCMRSRATSGRVQIRPSCHVWASVRSGAPAYLRLPGGGGFRRRTPGPPPFSSVNSTPADSSACLMTWSVDLRGSLFPASTWRIVTTPTLAASASCCWLQSRRPRAARHWAAVITAQIATQARRFVN
jgi:hypothetical protein